ncbi:carboxyltransferase domain-containing protein, partial [Aliivibrio sifiae]
MMMKISAVSEASVLVVFSDMVSPDTADIIAQSVAMIEQESDLFVIDMVPSYTSILITYDLTRIEL